MKAPVTLDALMDSWEKDAVIDDSEPGKELIRISLLHSKYLNILTYHRVMATKADGDYKTLKSVKWEYYKGDLNNPEDLKRYNLEPQLKTILRQDIPLYLDSDTELNKLLSRKSFHNEIVEYCTSVLKELHSRTFQLKSMIEWHRFTNGG
jgi:hypothetical protein